MQDYNKHAKLNTLKLPNRKKQATKNNTKYVKLEFVLGLPKCLFICLFV